MALQAAASSDPRAPLLLDCRNYYESRIGHFDGALCPDIRKFSYFPEYVRANRALFQDRTVLMYCTGGIRCERGSAVLLQETGAAAVLQLGGGIHRYLEAFPEGLYRGALYVFDERGTIRTNAEVLTGCASCGVEWDAYASCRSPHCRLLVLCCEGCRAEVSLRGVGW